MTGFRQKNTVNGQEFKGALLFEVIVGSSLTGIRGI